jgi:hypothetical protein
MFLKEEPRLTPDRATYFVTLLLTSCTSACSSKNGTNSLLGILIIIINTILGR